MKIVNLSQREEDWLDWRRQGVTATDAAILLNRSPYKTRWRLWAEKTGYLRVSKLGGIRWWLERVAELFQLYWESTDGRFRW